MNILIRMGAALRAIPLVLLAGTAAAGAPPPAAGVNMSGGEYGQPGGVLEKDYHYPGDAELAWAKTQGFVLIRLPFQWERLQPALNGELDSTELQRLSGVVARARALDLTIVLDPHNYAKWRGKQIGSPDVPASAFADFWRRLALHFGKDRNVIFGLMNEPNKIPVLQWRDAAQSALDAIRSTGACNLTLVPGANWSGAHSWNALIDGASNAEAFAHLRDKGVHAIEFHQYLDHDWSGEHAECRKPEEVVAAMSVATDWLRKTRNKGFLGEFGAGSDAQCLAGLNAMLEHINDNPDVWLGWTYWAAGAWWPPGYALSIQPRDGKPAPHMATLSKWIAASPAPQGCK